MPAWLILWYSVVKTFQLSKVFQPISSSSVHTTTDFQHVWPAMADVKVIQIAEVNPKDGNEVILTKVRVPLNPPESTETLSASKMKSILKNIHESLRFSTVAFFYKDDRNQFIRILDTEAPWPVQATGDGELLAWYLLQAESEDESENEDENDEFVVICRVPRQTTSE